jgi:hypothetical protein
MSIISDTIIIAQDSEVLEEKPFWQLNGWEVVLA